MAAVGRQHRSDDNGAHRRLCRRAAEAGLKVGDIITSVDGKQVTADELAAMIQSHAVGMKWRSR
jgi:hypothetical protein